MHEVPSLNVISECSKQHALSSWVHRLGAFWLFTLKVCGHCIHRLFDRRCVDANFPGQKQLSAYPFLWSISGFCVSQGSATIDYRLLFFSQKCRTTLQNYIFGVPTNRSRSTAFLSRGVGIFRTAYILLVSGVRPSAETIWLMKYSRYSELALFTVQFHMEVFTLLK